MPPLTLWKFCAFFALCVAVFSVILLPMFPKSGAADLSGYGGPVFAFEAAQSPSDLTAIFGAANDPARAERVAAMDRGNHWDFLFMALYGIFTALFFLALSAQTQSKVWLIFACIGLLSGVMDGWENMMLLQISANLDNPPFLGTLGVAVWSKFFAIAACIVAAGVYLLKKQALVWKIFGGLAILGALSVPIAFSNPSAYGWLLEKGVAAGWIVMSLYAYGRCVNKFAS